MAIARRKARIHPCVRKQTRRSESQVIILDRLTRERVNFEVKKIDLCQMRRIY